MDPFLNSHFQVVLTLVHFTWLHPSFFSIGDLININHEHKLKYCYLLSNNTTINTNLMLIQPVQHLRAWIFSHAISIPDILKYITLQSVH